MQATETYSKGKILVILDKRKKQSFKVVSLFLTRLSKDFTHLVFIVQR